MNYLELTNLTLQELNYKTVSDFSELVKPDHKKILETVSRINENLTNTCDWSFLMREIDIDVPANATAVPIPIGLKIKAAYLDGSPLEYSNECHRFLDKKGYYGGFSTFNCQVLIMPREKATKLKLFYKTKNSAKTADGKEIPRLTNGSDTTLIPDQHARNVVVFGACMQFKSNPEHPKYKHWLRLFTDGYSQMRADSEFIVESPPKIKLPRWTVGFDRY